ncbi:MAG TPA: addiction module toxin, HicA family [Deltaproteobacteria bacterium]|nr:MAG: addiction module toxin, HicA family [Deltaproteobacteria bacterium GWA2_45_12]HBF13469.1 addiction module toxin, HicA family [Deltaproteobacteria bacterium]
MTASELIRKLKKAGFIFDRQAKGSHEIWYNPETKKRTIVPNHSGRELPKGTLRAIIRQMGITPHQFDEL